MTKST